LKKLTDDRLVELLQGTEQECDIALSHIQIYFSGLALLYKLIVQEGKKPIQDFEEIASDALLELASAVQKGKFRFESSLNSYFTSIGKNIWRTRLRRAKSIHTQDIDNETIRIEPSIEKDIETEYLREIIRSSYAQITDNCRQIITMRFNKEMGTEAIATSLKMKTQSVKNQLSRCRSKLRDIIKAYING